MEKQSNYKVDLYEVKISNRIGKINVEYFEGSNIFRCIFINDKFSDFINSYKSFGFLVDKTGALTNIQVNGTFPYEEALSVWEQIEREDRPLHSASFSIK